jgi:hypothetical protein
MATREEIQQGTRLVLDEWLARLEYALETSTDDGEKDALRVEIRKVRRFRADAV